MTKATLLLLYYKFENSNSTFANGEVKEFKEVREVKARCFIAKNTTKRLLAITSLTTITSVHAKLQSLILEKNNPLIKN